MRKQGLEAQEMTGRALVIRTVGDPHIGKAVSDGMLKAQQMRMVQDEIIRQRAARSLMRVDIGRGGWSREDYNTLIESAALTYAEAPRRETALRSLGKGILGLYGLFVLMVRGYFDFDNARWKGV